MFAFQFRNESQCQKGGLLEAGANPHPPFLAKTGERDWKTQHHMSLLSSAEEIQVLDPGASHSEHTLRGSWNRFSDSCGTYTWRMQHPDKKTFKQAGLRSHHISSSQHSWDPCCQAAALPASPASLRVVSFLHWARRLKVFAQTNLHKAISRQSLKGTALNFKTQKSKGRVSILHFFHALLHYLLFCQTAKKNLPITSPEQDCYNWLCGNSSTS